MWQRVSYAPDTSTRLLHRERYTVGQFDCGPRSPEWGRENQIGDGPLVVFPSTAVEITHAGRAPVVANANVVMFYNRDQPYTRRLLDRRGDHCIHLGVSWATFAELAAEHDPARAEHLGRPFPFDRGPGSPRTWLRKDALVRYLDQGSPDELFVEETVLALVREVVGLAFGAIDRPARGRAQTTSRHRDAARRLEEILALRPELPSSLAELADQVGLSPFHAARVFRRFTGASLHDYRTHLRVKTSLGRLAEPNRDLADLALELGFANHSHFTDQFRRIFGVPPSRIRGELTVARIRELEREIDRRLNRARS